MTFFLSRLSHLNLLLLLGRDSRLVLQSVACLQVPFSSSYLFPTLYTFNIFFMLPPQHTYLFTPLQCQEHRAYTRANALSARAISQPLNQPLPCPCACSGLQKLISLLFDFHCLANFFIAISMIFSYMLLSCSAYFIVAAL